MLVFVATLHVNIRQVDAQDAALLARFTRQLTSAVPTQKVQAAGQLAKLGEAASSATELLIACLDDTDPDVRLYSAYAIGEVAKDLPRALKTLVPVLADKNEHVRYSAEWAIAKIARRIENASSIDSSQLASVTASLEATLVRFGKQDHQPRHARAVRSALESIASARELEREQATKRSTASKAETIDAVTAIAIARLQKQFAVADRVQALLLIESVRANYLNQPEVLLEAMYNVLSRNDFYLLEFAANRWGKSGHAAMKKALLSLVDDQMPTWTPTLLANVVPNDRQLFERILDIAINRRLPLEVRSAALHSLGRTTVDRTRAQAALVSMLLDRAELEESRLEAEMALAKLGELPTTIHASLLAIINLPDETQSLRESVLSDLQTFAPNSVEAVQAITSQLRSLQKSDERYVLLANSIAKFGPKGAAALPPLMNGLSSSEEYVRVACAKAIGELGEAAFPATSQLVAIVVDPQVTISTKSEVALVLRKIGARAVVPIAEKLSSADPVVREHVLRSLVIVGPIAKAAVSDCLKILANPREVTSVRAAAASSVGAFGSASLTAAPTAVAQLEAATQDNEEPSLRVAALLALSQIQPAAAMPRIAAFAANSSRELRVGAAFAKHLAGLTVESSRDLIGLSEYSNNHIIEETLADLGPVILPLLLDTMRDTNATDEQRITCMRVASKMHPTDWSPMIDLLSHERLGQEFFESVLNGWDFDDNLLPQLMGALQNEQTPTGGRARMLQLADYITSDLGAGDDYEEWTGSFAISRLVTKSESSEQTAMAAPPIPHKAQAMPEGINHSQIDEPLLIPDTEKARTPSPLASVEDRLVKVFYGTNRQPTSVVASKPAAERTSAPGYGAAMGLAIAALATCCFGFLRRKSPKYTLAAVTGLAACTSLAVQTIRFTDSAVKEIENVEYGTQLSETVEMGVCEVTIPESHRTGELESPLLLQMDFTEDPAKHIVLKSVHRLDPDSFFDDMHHELTLNGNNVLVFVHGYNVSFEDAARRTAQMAFDLKFPGAPVFYSWPSQANWYGYRHDSENIKNSVDQIKSFLTEIAAKSKATSINLVAHSMGNVGLTSALLRMSDSTKFNQIVLAAPDIDAEVFKHDIAPKIVPRGNRVTLYTSKTDLALIASKYFNHGQRAGDSGSELLLVPGMQTIDATAVDSSLLGHSYYGSNVSVLYDLGQLLNGQPIEARDYLRPNSDLTRPYWYFVPTQTAARSTIPIVPLRR